MMKRIKPTGKQKKGKSEKIFSIHVYQSLLEGRRHIMKKMQQYCNDQFHTTACQLHKLYVHNYKKIIRGSLPLLENALSKITNEVFTSFLTNSQGEKDV